ncbi:MAG: FG-GAP-like repeat-containing protein [Gemmataceae bacterium]
MRSILARLLGRWRRSHAARRTYRPQVALLENRLLPAGVLEVEPNNSPATAQALSIPSQDVTTAVADDWLQLNGSIATNTDQDYYRFSLSQRSGVFLIVNARQQGLSSLDSMLTVLDATGQTVLGQNDDGYDFITGYPAPKSWAGWGTAKDSSLYLDLSAGEYLVRVSGVNGTTGDYRLKLLADSTYTNSVPVFHSYPQASATVYLDFDGHTGNDAWGSYTVSAYDFNGNPHEYTPAERLAIHNIWRTVADDFSPFAINVTTHYTGPFDDRVGFRVVVTNDNGSAVGFKGVYGVAYPDSFSKRGSWDQVAFVFARNFPTFGDAVSGRIVAQAIEIGNTASHEFGHALGLEHYGGTNGQPGAIMHTPDTGLNRETWSVGYTHSGEPPVVYQDDMAIIANSTNGFGYRPRQYGHSLATATVLTPIGNGYQAAGVITRPQGPGDFFRVSLGGQTTITVHVSELFGNLDAVLKVYDGNGTLIGTNAPAPSLGASLMMELMAGNYVVEVASSGAPGSAGQYRLHIHASELPAPASDPVATPVRRTFYATGADAGGGPHVKVFDAETGKLHLQFFAYAPHFTGGVRVAVGDVNNDGWDDIITVPGPGGGPHVRVFSGKDGSQIANFMAYAPTFAGGLFVAVGDVNGDGYADIITGPDAGGGPHVKVFSGKDGTLLMNFFAYHPTFTGGVRVAAGDLDGDGKADIITGAGPGGGPHVLAFRALDRVVLHSFMAYSPSFTGGVYVAAGDVNGDTRADIVTGAGFGGSAHVKVVDGVTQQVMHNFLADSSADYVNGVRVAVITRANTNRADLLIGYGPHQAPKLRIFDSLTLQVLDDFFAYDTSFRGGVFVG